MKTPDGQIDLAGTEHLASLPPGKRWIVHRLLRKGYRRYNSSDGVMWFAYGHVTDFTDPHNLLVEVSVFLTDGKASFRMWQAPDVHITRYLTLSHEDGWQKLDDFERFFESVRNEHLSNVGPRSGALSNPV